MDFDNSHYVEVAKTFIQRMDAEQRKSNKPVLTNEVVIQRGGNGIVFILNEVAFKTDWTVDEMNVAKNKNLEEEMHFMNLIKHTNVIKLYGSFVLDFDFSFLRASNGGRTIRETIPKGKLFICMESVKHIDYTIRYLGTKQILNIASKLTDALMYMHAMNVAHLDINDNNVLIRESDFEPKIIDLGMTTYKTITTRHKKKQITSIVSEVTQRYHAPPEVYTNLFSPKKTGIVISGRYDAWSLGVYLLELLCKEQLYLVISPNNEVPHTPDKEWEAINAFFQSEINDNDQADRAHKINALLNRVNPGWNDSVYGDALVFVVAGILSVDVSHRYNLHHINMLLSRLKYMDDPHVDVLFPLDVVAMLRNDDDLRNFGMRYATSQIVGTCDFSRPNTSVIQTDTMTSWYSSQIPGLMVKTIMDDANHFKRTKTEIAFLSMTQFKMSPWFPKLQTWFFFYNGNMTYDNASIPSQTSIQRIYQCYEIPCHVFPLDHAINNEWAIHNTSKVTEHCIAIIRDVMRIVLFLHAPFDINDGASTKYWVHSNISKETFLISWEHKQVLVTDTSRMYIADDISAQTVDLRALGSLILEVWVRMYDMYFPIMEKDKIEPINKFIRANSQLLSETPVYRRDIVEPFLGELNKLKLELYLKPY